jgi:hypothetical protein
MNMYVKLALYRQDMFKAVDTVIDCVCVGKRDGMTFVACKESHYWDNNDKKLKFRSTGTIIGKETWLSLIGINDKCDAVELCVCKDTDLAANVEKLLAYDETALFVWFNSVCDETSAMKRIEAQKAEHVERDKKEAERMARYEANRQAERDKLAAEKAAFNDLGGYEKTLTPLQLGKVARYLKEKSCICQGVAATMKEHAERLVNGGAELTTFQEHKVKDMTRTQFNRADYNQQREHARRQAAAGMNAVYLVGGYDLGKTCYDYAAWYINNKLGVK